MGAREQCVGLYAPDACELKIRTVWANMQAKDQVGTS